MEIASHLSCHYGKSTWHSFPTKTEIRLRNEHTKMPTLVEKQKLLVIGLSKETSGNALIQQTRITWSHN